MLKNEQGERKVEKQKRFLKGVFIGAVVGGAYTLFERETRDAMVEMGKETCEKVGKFVRHPIRSTENLRENIREVKETFQEIREDFKFVTDKVHELTDRPQK